MTERDPAPEPRPKPLEPATPEPPKSERVRRRGAALKITILYVLGLTGLAGATMVFKIPLSEGEGFLRFPSAWALVLDFAYYGLPPLAAVAFGLLRRPFAKNALTLLLIIFVVQGVYSVAATTLHIALARKLSSDTTASMAAIGNLVGFKRDLIDGNGDGLVDRVVLEGGIEATALPRGDYTVTAVVWQSPPGRQQRVAGQVDFSFASKESGLLDFVIEFDPRSIQDLASGGPLEIGVDVTKTRRFGHYARTIVAICAWSPFACPMPRVAWNRVTENELIELRRFRDVGQVELAAPQIQREQLVVQGFAGDFGRDLDGDGGFDELVVEILVDSIYRGPVYFQAEMQTPFRAVLQHESRVAEGPGRLEFVIDGTQISRSGLDGPYQIGAFVLMNNSPVCPGGVCATPNQPPFTVYLDSYTTAPYRAREFE